jgi:hypothetical protein
MNDMKKTIAILLVLVIGMTGVFAAFTNTENQNLIISTEINTVNAFKITETDESESSFYSVFGFTGEENPTDATRTIDIDDGLTTAAWLTIGTNNPSGFVVYLQSASKLAKDETSSKIDYTISVGSASWDTSDAPTTGQSVGSVAASNAAEVTSKQITVTIDPETYYNAEATSGEKVYEATVVFNVSAN